MVLSLGFFDIHFDAEQTLFPHLVEKLVHHLEGIEIALFAEPGTADYSFQSAEDAFENMRRVGDQQSAESRAGNDEQLGGLNEHLDMPLFP